jgi:hypothetical protein
MVLISRLTLLLSIYVTIAVHVALAADRANYTGTKLLAELR